jgi:hypothetical protein
LTAVDSSDIARELSELREASAFPRDTDQTRDEVRDNSFDAVAMARFDRLISEDEMRQIG